MAIYGPIKYTVSINGRQVSRHREKAQAVNRLRRLRLRKGDEAFLDKITGPGEDDREQVMHRIGQKIYFED